MTRLLPVTLLALLFGSLAPHSGADRKVAVSGELKQWHKVTLTLDGPLARERDTDPNPFLDYRLSVRFEHESGSPSYDVPGYFAADGNAGETSAEEGTKWRAHLSPDKPGRWAWRVSFVKGPRAAVDPRAAVETVAGVDGATGTFDVLPTDKTGRDFRARGRLQYEGGHYLRFAGGDFFLKAGPDAPETLLAYADFDGTVATKKEGPLKTWAPHLRDWRPGDPTWKGSRGKGLVGALNYLASRGVNAFSFLTYNAGGDGDNVWPFVARNAKLHYDASKLDQWQIVFDHAQALGLFLHFKTQETENDDQRLTHERTRGTVPEALDGGAVGVERRLYCRELVARFGYLLALNWNLGEENTQAPDEQRAAAAAIHDFDPYDHLVVVHTHPGDQDLVYTPLLGPASGLTGASLQNHWDAAHERVLKWRRASARAGKPWVVANDEQGDAALGVPPDPGFEGFSGRAKEKGGREYDLHDVRRHTLWGTLLAGGAGVEYYFGYSLPQNDLLCEDWRSRERSWAFAAVALRFFADERIPFWEMEPADALVGNAVEDNSRYGFAKPGEIYLVYLPKGGTAELDLAGASGRFTVAWLDPRRGGPLQRGAVREVAGGGRVDLGSPPADVTDDWLVVVRRPALAAGGAADAAPRATTRPNVVFILADDLGYGDLGAYGQRLVRTPNLDRLAAEGIRFTDFYAGSTVCAPSRAVLMAGRHTGHASVRGNAGGGALSIQALRDSERTLAHLFKDAGYATALFGKWGLGEIGSPGHPNRMGFDVFFGYLNQRHAHNYYPSFLIRDETRVPLRNLPGREDADGAGWARTRVEYSHDVIVDSALRWVDENRGRPFFLYLAVTIPHANNEARAATGDGQEVPDYGDYAGEPWPGPDKGQAAMISRLDRDVGRLLARLEERGLARDTLVLFSSDNGPHQEGGNDPERFGASGPLRGMKRALYEGGIRVPMIARWPGRIAAGSVSSHVGYFGDFFATFADLLGRPVPPRLDSLSLLPTLSGRPADQEVHEYLYWEFYEQGGRQAVRFGPWKAIREPMKTGRLQLFDLSKDVGEGTDLASARPEIAARAARYLDEAHVPDPAWEVR
jgi:arylsulfatase A-like enzyme